ncbi:MAG: ERF family protein [Clostridium sp.]|nr:ERF family protein [Clostridium sp.]
MNIYEKLQSARVKLQDKKLKKSGKNKHTGFSYFELADFLPSVNIIFSEIGLFSNFSLCAEKAVLTIYDTESNDNITFETPTANAQLKGCTEVQSLGAVHTYLKRYLYLNALEIVESETLDPLVGSDEIEEINNNDDFDIIAGVESLNTVKEIADYSNQYVNKVSNRSSFIKAINARRKAISEV